MKVLILSQYYAPEPVDIPSEIAHHLRERGHQVRVLTGYPNYPHGELYAGHRLRWRHRETIGKIDVLRVPLYVDHSQNAVKRSLNYISFALTSASAWSFVRGADVVYVYATQMTPAFGPALWRTIHNTPFVLHIQDLWPDSIVGSSLAGRALATRTLQSALTTIITSIYERASAVVAIAPTMLQTLIERGCDSKKTHLIHNWAPEVFTSTSLALKERNDETSIIYGGNVGDLQDLETAIRAAHATADIGIRLRIVGDGVALERLRRVAGELGTRNVQFIPRVSRPEMAALYAESDFALITLKDRPTFHGTIPSKLQAALASAAPLICSVPGDARAIVTEERVGFTAAPEDQTSLEAAFRSAGVSSPAERLAMSQRASNLYQRTFSRQHGLNQMENILKTATTDHKGRTR